MTTFLYYLTPQTGHVFPLVPTWLELMARGHRVAVRCIPSQVELLRDLGIDAKPVDPRIVAREQDDWRAKGQIGALNRSMRTWLDRAPLEIEDVRAALEQTSPDVLVIDMLCWGAASTAEQVGLPWAWVATAPLAIDSAQLPPPGLGLPAMPGPIGRVRDLGLRAVSRAVMRPHLKALNDQRRNLGVSPVTSLTDLWSAHAPLTLEYLSTAFELPRTDWPDTVKVVGAGVWSPPSDPPAWVSELTKPVVLVSCSTERQNDDALALAALEAFANDDVSLVVTSAAANLDTTSLPPNARVERFVPHSALLPHAACVVSAGGMGLVHNALAAGVPVCVVSFGRDQPEVALRVVTAGVGVSLPSARLTPARLREAVTRARALRSNAAAIAPRLGADQSAALAADALEALAP
jgi:MGT family glycosyltransferase